ncbi:EVE domain-containing protein [Fontivita pretiosa]|uniref:EVE domain-containing protein n=1 Tax=Fontivita pretiosa TaxID=2989684 RepID=UPI003D17324C
MAYWLVKTEPDSYSFDDLIRQKRTVWDGVTNALALKHIRNMKKGDLALVYHTGEQRAVVGVARIVSDPYPDPAAHDSRIVVVDLEPMRRLPRPVTLDQIKADPTFAGWELLRISRLSVMPVPAKMWKRIQTLAQTASTRTESSAEARTATSQA